MVPFAVQESGGGPLQQARRALLVLKAQKDSRTRLSVNINKAALLRNSRGTDAPRLLDVAQTVLDAGADGLTVHPRADERHITRRDAIEVMREFGSQTEINFEGDIREDFLDLVLTCKPHQCTLVPVSFGEITSHRGWDFQRWDFLLRPVIKRLQAEGVRVSVFADPEPEAAERAAELGADRIEIYTEPFAAAWPSHSEPVLEQMRTLAERAKKCGVGLNAGHDLTVRNLPDLLDSVKGIQEVSIGHHLFCRALDVGLTQSVKEFLDICRATATIS